MMDIVNSYVYMRLSIVKNAIAVLVSTRIIKVTVRSVNRAFVIEQPNVVTTVTVLEFCS